MQTLPERLSTPRALLGTFCITPDAGVVEILAIAGFEAVVIDLEHGPFGIESVPSMTLAAHTHDAYAIVRVRANEPSLIGAALDAGADGVLVPQVDSYAAAQTAVRSARFAPEGNRGANPYVRAAAYSGGPDWFAEANRTTTVMVMIEGVAGFESLPEVLPIPHLGGVFVGPVDLSHALGLAGQPEHPGVIEKIQQIVAAASARNVATGVFAPSAAAARCARDLGVRFIAFGVDTTLALDGFRRAVEEATTP
jgi:4-hydroxy-2-oxoheptanedioate aldolase